MPLPSPRSPRTQVRTLARSAAAESLADVERERGNLAFRSGDFERAEAAYSRAVAADRSLPAAWANRSMARIKTGDPTGAAADATQALLLLEWDDSLGAEHASAALAGKCLLRRSVARSSLGLLRLAIVDAAAACASQPASAQAAAQLQRLVRRREASVRAEPRRPLEPRVSVADAEAMTEAAAGAEASAAASEEPGHVKPHVPDAEVTAGGPSPDSTSLALGSLRDEAGAANTTASDDEKAAPGCGKHVGGAPAAPPGVPCLPDTLASSKAKGGARLAEADVVATAASTTAAEPGARDSAGSNTDVASTCGAVAKSRSAAASGAVARGRGGEAKPAKKAKLGGFELEAAWAAAASPVLRWKLLTGLGKGGIGACFARSGGSAMDGEFAGQIIQTLAKQVAAGDEAVLAKAKKVTKGLLAAPMWSMTFDMLEESDREALAGVKLALE